MLPVITVLLWGLNLEGAEVVLFDPAYAAVDLWRGMPRLVVLSGDAADRAQVIEGRDVRVERARKRHAKELIDEWGEGVTGVIGGS